jgi:hypothetical protein
MVDLDQETEHAPSKSQNIANLTQDSAFSNLLSLPHLPIRKTRGREPLVDYSQSHVVTFDVFINHVTKGNGEGSGRRS